MDTLVDPVETVSSSHLRAALPVASPRPSFKSLDPDAQVQWFSRALDEEGSSSIDIDVSWEEEVDSEPTLVQRRRGVG